MVITVQVYCNCRWCKNTSVPSFSAWVDCSKVALAARASSSSCPASTPTVRSICVPSPSTSLRKRYRVCCPFLLHGRAHTFSKNLNKQANKAHIRTIKSFFDDIYPITLIQSRWYEILRRSLVAEHTWLACITELPRTIGNLPNKDGFRFLRWVRAMGKASTP